MKRVRESSFRKNNRKEKSYAANVSNNIRGGTFIFSQQIQFDAGELAQQSRYSICFS